MNKKIFTLLILLLLLPVTALAAEEIKLFIGGQKITDSGCYKKIKTEIGQRLRVVTVQNLPAVSFPMTPPPSPLR